MSLVQLSFDVETVCADLLDRIDALLTPRRMSAMERTLLAALFWTRAGDSAFLEVVCERGGMELALEPGFARGFVAQALRLLGARKLALVA